MTEPASQEVCFVCGQPGFLRPTGELNPPTWCYKCWTAFNAFLKQRPEEQGTTVKVYAIFDATAPISTEHVITEYNETSGEYCAVAFKDSEAASRHIARSRKGNALFTHKAFPVYISMTPPPGMTPDEKQPEEQPAATPQSEPFTPKPFTAADAARLTTEACADITQEREARSRISYWGSALASILNDIENAAKQGRRCIIYRDLSMNELEANSISDKLRDLGFSVWRYGDPQAMEIVWQKEGTK